MAFTKFGGMIMPVVWRTGVVPSGWFVCDGTAVSRTTYADLYALIGTIFGVGDGSTTFNLPDMRGKAAVGAGSGVYSGATAHTLGASYGEAYHTLLTTEIPSHRHVAAAYGAGGGSADPAGNLPAFSTALGNCYRASAAGTAMFPGMVGNTGGAQPHENRPPFAAVTWLIAYADVDPEYVIGEMRLWPSSSIPTNWRICDGTSYATAAQPNLFSAISYLHGGSGANFNVPDMRGRVPICLGTGAGLSARTPVGTTGGAEKVSVGSTEMPVHAHLLAAVSGRGSITLTNSPAGNLPAKTTGNVYDAALTPPIVAMHADAIGLTGGGLAHENRGPCVALNWIIAIAQ